MRGLFFYAEGAMHRLEDIRAKDLEQIYKVYRDFTKQMELQTGSEKITVWGDLQDKDMEMSASERPVNAFTQTLYVMAKEMPKSFAKKLSQGAILYVSGEAFKVVDASEDGGVFVISLERGTQRGKGLTGREL
jgi:hypothetical protein